MKIRLSLRYFSALLQAKCPPSCKKIRAKKERRIINFSRHFVDAIKMFYNNSRSSKEKTPAENTTLVKVVAAAEPSQDKCKTSLSFPRKMYIIYRTKRVRNRDRKRTTKE